MKSALFVAGLSFIAGAVAQLQVSTPAQLVTCQPAAITWSGGVAPYYLSVLPGGQTGATALENFPTQSGTSYTWPKVDIAAGITITIQIRDSTGSINYSSPVDIQQGPDTSCVGGNSSGGTVLNSSGVQGTQTQSGSATQSSGTSPTSSGSAASPSTTKSGAAGLKAAGLTVAGVAGLVGAALL